jgi:hypothetical protein
MIRHAIIGTIFAAATLAVPVATAAPATAAMPGTVVCVHAPCLPLPVAVETIAPRNYRARGWSCYHAVYHVWVCVHPHARRRY